MLLGTLSMAPLQWNAMAPLGLDTGIASTAYPPPCLHGTGYHNSRRPRPKMCEGSDGGASSTAILVSVDDFLNLVCYVDQLVVTVNHSVLC